MRPPAAGARACLPPPTPVARVASDTKSDRRFSGRSRAFSRCGSAAMVKYCIAVHLPCTAEEYMVLKDDPEYVRYQLGVVGARELSRVSELGADGFVTQTIVNRPNIAVPRVLRPLLRGKEIEFRDVRRYRHGTQTTVPFEVDLEVFNSISDRVTQRARIRIANVEIDQNGAVRETEDAEGREDAEDEKESPSESAVSDPFVSSKERVAERVALNAVGIKTCEIRCTGEVTIRVGPFSRRAEDLTVANMRRAYGRFPAIVAEWRKTRDECDPRRETRGDRIPDANAKRTSGDVSARPDSFAEREKKEKDSTSSSPRARRGDGAASSEGSTRDDDDDDDDDDGCKKRRTRGFFASRWLRAALEKADAARLRAKGRRAIRVRGARESSRGRVETIVVPDDEYLF